MSIKNIEAFCITPDEQTIFAANKMGEILIIDVDTFQILNREQIHMGSMNVIAVHQNGQYLSSLGNDGYLSICKIINESTLVLLHLIKIRDLKPEFDRFKRGPSVSQALALHPKKLRLASRAGTAGVFELEFDEQSYKIIHCTRLHDAYDPFTLCYTGKNNELLSGANGTGGIVLSEDGKIINKWHAEKGLHWFERLNEDNFLIACDSMQMLRLNIRNNELPYKGPIISRSHLEHITYNPISKKAYTTAFEHKVLEVDPTSGEIKKLIWVPPFKCRWAHSLQSSPDVLIVQCRNGGLYKINVASGRVIQKIKETQHALWTIAEYDSVLYTAGEGNHFQKFMPQSVDDYLYYTRYCAEQHEITKDDYQHTKTLRVNEKYIAFGRSSGELIVHRMPDLSSVLSVQLSDFIKDIALSEQDVVYACCEDGALYQVNLITHEVIKLYQSEKPLWSLALNGSKLAFSNRVDRMYLYNLEKNNVQQWTSQYAFAHVMRWADDQHLYFCGGSMLYKVAVGQDKKSLVLRLPNSIRDFAWDQQRRYLVVVAYTRFLYLCDYGSGEILDVHADRADYSKGITFLDKSKNLSGYHSDFVVVGRAGLPIGFRIHDDRILNCGFLT